MTTTAMVILLIIVIIISVVALVLKFVRNHTWEIKNETEREMSMHKAPLGSLHSFLYNYIRYTTQFQCTKCGNTKEKIKDIKTS